MRQFETRRLLNFQSLFTLNFILRSRNFAKHHNCVFDRIHVWYIQVRATVDGQNPAPPRMMIIPLSIGFLTIPGGAGFCPSTVYLPTFTIKINVNYIIPMDPMGFCIASQMSKILVPSLSPQKETDVTARRFQVYLVGQTIASRFAKIHDVRCEITGWFHTCFQ